MDLTFAEAFFRISTNGSERSEYEVPAIELLHREPMLKLLEKYTALVKGTGLELAVSFLGVGIYGLVVTKHIVMSQYGRILDLPLRDITVQVEVQADHAHFVFKLSELSWTELSKKGRTAAVEKEWIRFFQEDINPLIESAAAAVGLKPDLIWNQYGSTAAYMMDYVRETMLAGPELERCEDDFALLCSLPGAVFNRHKNPFQHTPQYTDNPYQPDKPLMIRSACCLYYKREGGFKCYYCPILDTDERARLMAQIDAAHLL